MHIRAWIKRFLPYPSYQRELEIAVGTDCKTLLDVGCGSNSPIKILSKEFYCVGIDAYLPYIEKSKKNGIHNDYYNMTFSELDKLGTSAFDCVVALDVIEHLNRMEGLRLLDNLERIAKKRIIIFTPNGFVSQSEYDNNPWQIHRSGWTIKEMRARGYKIIGINGLKSLRGELALIRLRPVRFWALISALSQYFVRNYPELAFQILCTKVKE